MSGLKTVDVAMQLSDQNAERRFLFAAKLNPKLFLLT